MNKIGIFFFIICLIIISGCELNTSDKIQPDAVNGILDLTDWDLKRDKPVELSGEWEFYWQQFLNEKDFTNSSRPQKTGNISLPGTWNGYSVGGKKLSGHGYATFHLRVMINSSFNTMVLNVLTMQTANRVYINGELISSAGIPGTNSEISTPRYKPQSISYSPDKNYLDILIHVSNYDHRLGGIWGNIMIGAEEDLTEIWRYNRDKDFFVIGAIIIMGLYHLGLFFIRKEEREALYFSIYCFVVALRVIVTGQIYLLDLIPNLPWKALVILEYITFFAAIPLFTLFIYSLFKDSILKKVIRTLIPISSLFTFITIISPVRISSWLIPFFQITTLFTGIYILFLLIKYSIKKDKLAIIILSGFSIMFLTVINDILYAADVINSVYAISYGILLFIVFQAIVMTIRFARSFKEVERQRKQLLKTNTEYRSEIDERIRLEEELHISYQKNAKTRLAIIMGLAKLAEYRDSDTGTHIERIQEFNAVLAKQLQKDSKYSDYISDEYIKDLHISSILHDIGKVGIPDSILQKPGKLTAEEFEIMKEHASIGGDSIRTVEQKIEVRSFLTLGRDIAYMHHEKWDGTGYPGGIKGKDIPLSARLTALADVYDALTSKRCYKEAFTHERARDIIVSSKGTHFDPDIVDAFLEIQDVFDQIRSSLQDEIASVLE
jgi:response regulator RpfG family c-di-GMP phosphodiesterase